MKAIFTLEIDDQELKEAIQTLVDIITGSTRKPPIPGRSTHNPPLSDQKVSVQQLKGMIDRLIELTDKKQVNKLLKDNFGTITIGKIQDRDKLFVLLDDTIEDIEDQDGEGEDEDGGDDPEESEDGGDEDEDEDEDEELEEIDSDIVKKAYQSFVQENGVEEGRELLKEFGIKTPRGISGLSEKKLQDLFEEICE